MNAALEGVWHRFAEPLVPGRLIRRYKRFLADIRLGGGGEVTAHCPNSGSMLGCLADDAPVYLSPQDKPGRRTKFTWEMIKINGGWVGINTMLPNFLAAEAARLNAMPLFQGVCSVQREVKISPQSRVDLMVEDAKGKMAVEVKNVTLTGQGLARFPESPTARGCKHLLELMRIVDEGGRAAMLYVVQRRDAERFAPAGDIDPEYARLFGRARRRGVLMEVVQARVSPQGVQLKRRIPIFDP